MRARALRVGVAVASATAVLCVAVVDLRGASPGGLSTVHERVEGLRGSTGCDGCHGGWFQSMDDACLDCHETIGSHLDAGIGLHGTLDEIQAQACALCHSEHHGAAFQPTNLQSFVMAVAATPDEFDHASIGWEMTGEHLALECAECHDHAGAQPLPEGATRFIGLDRDCASCHDDPHEGALARLACADCHSQEGFDQLSFQGHAERLHLEGGHAGVGCRECHEQGDEHSLEALTKRRREVGRECTDCHESPHARAFVGGFARAAGTSQNASCIECHEATHASFRDEELELDVEEHAFSGFELVAPHDDVTCARCHGPGMKRFARRYPGRGPDDCAACHDDPHGGQFADGPFAERGCVACHDRLRFEPHAFGLERHARSSFALSGSHVEADCDACHVVEREGEPRRFAGTPGECDACHSDAHQGYFARALESIEPHPNGECAQCHDASTFAHVVEPGFAHRFWTGFPVDGAHAQGDCTACHLDAPEPDRHGRTFGRVADTFGDFQGCESCHDDPHRGTFDVASLPRRVEGSAGCARCHEASSFRSLLQPFDHGKWTGFRLEGAHAEARCAVCHAPVLGEDVELASGASLPGKSYSAAAGASCDACHASPHGDQFEEGVPRTCAACHAGANGFADLAFHHDRDTRFRLGKAHRDLGCSACHEPRVQDGVEIVRYRGVGRECTDCHGVHQDALRGGGRNDR